MEDHPYRSAQAEPLRDPPPRSPLPWVIKILALLGIVVLAVGLLMPATRRSGETGRRAQCTSQLRQIALAMQMYAHFNGAFPPAYTVDANGERLHSWRTLILPYLEQAELYKQIDLTRPWDDAVNAAARATCPPDYQCPSATLQDNQTSYLAVVTAGSWLRASEPRPVADQTPAEKRSLLIIEADAKHAVHWMSPFDADEELLMSLGPEESIHPGGFQAALVDGSVQLLSGETSPDEWRRLIRGEMIEPLRDD